MKKFHYPVMYKEIIENLNFENKKIIIDCTIGIGSHALKFFEIMNKNSFLIGIDKDEESLKIAQERLKNYIPRFKLFKEDFRNIDLILDSLNIEKADIFFFDLGLSSYQLSNTQRGFSFLREGPLDMRMDKNSFLCAYDLINHLSEPELVMIFKKFGEEKFSKRIAHLVVKKRRYIPITTTTQLSSLVLEAVPKKTIRYRIHPATRIFQALRIVVNRELDSLEIGLKKAVERLSQGGRIGVIAFHSLEDRIVKHTFRDFALRGKLRIISKVPLVPSYGEVKENISSRSAKLRIAERQIWD